MLTPLLSRGSNVARAMWVHQNTLYVGWQDPGGLSVFDLSRNVETAFHPLPRQVTAITVAGGQVFASLPNAEGGPVYVWPDPTCAAPPAIVPRLYADYFATEGDEVWFASRSGTICRHVDALNFDIVADVKKDLFGICVLGGQIYGAFKDNKVRVWPTYDAKKKPEALIRTGHCPSIAAATDGHWWTVDYPGLVTRWSMTQVGVGTAKVKGGPYAMRIRSGFGGHVAVFTQERPVVVLSPSLEIVDEVPVPGRVEDVWLAAARLLVAGEGGVSEKRM